jgi:hypothetical protein
MARDAQIHGDRVDVEYYLQHVEHYTRTLSDIYAIEAERFAAQREQQIVPGGPNDPNSEAYQASPRGDNQGGTSEQPYGNANMGDDMNTNSNQPRMTRQHRPAAQPASSASDESSNQSGDIPLPGSALPAI